MDSKSIQHLFEENPVSATFGHHVVLLVVWAITALFVGFIMFIVRRKPVMSSAGLMSAIWGGLIFVAALSAKRFIPEVYDASVRNVVVGCAIAGFVIALVGLGMALKKSFAPRVQGFGWGLLAQGVVIALLHLRIDLVLGR